MDYDLRESSISVGSVESLLTTKTIEPLLESVLEENFCADSIQHACAVVPARVGVVNTRAVLVLAISGDFKPLLVVLPLLIYADLAGLLVLVDADSVLHFDEISNLRGRVTFIYDLELLGARERIKVSEILELVLIVRDIE